METLCTERITLRAFAEGDAEDIFAWASDAWVTKYLSFQPHKSIDATKEVLAGWIAAYTDEDHYSWAIVSGGKVIGRIQTDYVNRRHRRCEVGYYIGHDYWNRGLMTEALRCVLEYFFNRVGFNRVEAIYEPDNPASGRVMQKCGMKVEGTLRQFFLCRDGSYTDGLLYAILNLLIYQEVPHAQHRLNQQMARARGRLCPAAQGGRAHADHFRLGRGSRTRRGMGAGARRGVLRGL